jgi:WD40 repeat protein
MALNWDVGDAPSTPPRNDPPPSRRRAILATLGGIALLVVVGGALVSWQRQGRLATAERAVRAAAELEQQALAAKDPELLTAILPDGVSRLGQIRLVRDAQLPVPGVAIVGDRGMPEEVRFRASRPLSPLDRAEVDVRIVVSDSYATGHVLRRRQFAQATDGQWRLDVDGNPADRSGKPTPWVGTVLTTTVKAADEALGRDLHAALDADLAAFCAAVRAAGRLMAWNSCSFQLLSDGLPVKRDRRGNFMGAALNLPSPPGGLAPADEAGRNILRRAYLHELTARWLGRDRTPWIEILLDAWLAPETATTSSDGARRDWAELSANLHTFYPAEKTTSERERLVQNLRLLAADVLQVGGRNALLGLIFSWQPASAALWLSEGLADEQLERAVLARWEHAPAPMPGKRAVLAQCLGSEFGNGWPMLFLPGRREGMPLDQRACPANSTAEAAVWRPGTSQLAVQCTDPGGMDEPGPFVRILDLRSDGSLVPVAPDWLPDGEVQAATLAWSPDGRRLSATRTDGVFIVWHVDGKHPEMEISTIPNGSYFEHTDWAADSSRASLTVKEFDGSNGTFLNQPMTFLINPTDTQLGGKLNLTADAWSPSGARLAAHGPWQADMLPLALVDGKTGVETARAEVRLDEVLLAAQPFSLWGTLTPIGWSPDGRWVALLARGRSIPEGLAWLPTRAGSMPEGLVEGRVGSALIAWRPDDGATRTIKLPEVIHSAAWTPEGNRILVARQPLDETAAEPVVAWSWSPESGVLSESAVPPVRWSPDGRWGVSTVGGQLALWPAGADRPSWSSAISDCHDASWQALPPQVPTESSAR